MAKIWELDFYSRPLLDENQKKLWEVLICDSPSEQDSPDKPFQYSQFCSNQSVNSLWLKEALEQAIALAGESPKKVRFFRRQMNNMITKACEDLGLIAAPSRRTLGLNRWLKDRQENFYPLQAGYDAQGAKALGAQYPTLNPIPLPEAIRGDKRDKWAFVSLEASAFAEMAEWDIGFGETFPLAWAAIAPTIKIPGFIIFSERALALAAWMSGLEMGYLKVENNNNRPIMQLETGASDSWILTSLTDAQTQAEAQGFEAHKKDSNNVHFLAIQSSPDSEIFAGFWLLKQEENIG
jgi:hypothetical protein